jgi:hypothetical protein
MLTLTEFKRFLAIDLTNTSKDDLLQDCICSAVKEMGALTNRRLEDGQSEETLDGNGSVFAYLNQYPVTEITKLQVRSNDGFSDIIKEPDTIRDIVLLLSAGKICLLKNYIFPEGESNILIAYRAGYMTADDWSENTKYKIGAIVRYQNLFYRCIQQHESGGEFNPEYWEALNSEAVSADLKKAVKYLAAKTFYDSPEGKNLLMKKSESSGGAFSKSVVYENLEIEHIINRYKKPNV